MVLHSLNSESDSRGDASTLLIHDRLLLNYSHSALREAPPLSQWNRATRASHRNVVTNKNSERGK